MQGADLQQLVPVGVVSGQPRALQPEHDPGLAERDLSDQPLETLPVGGGGAGAALVDIDDDDVAVGPAQRGGLAAQVVLAARRFGVVDDLIQRRLSDIQVGSRRRCAAVTMDGVSFTRRSFSRAGVIE